VLVFLSIIIIGGFYFNPTPASAVCNEPNYVPAEITGFTVNLDANGNQLSTSGTYKKAVQAETSGQGGCYFRYFGVPNIAIGGTSISVAPTPSCSGNINCTFSQNINVSSLPNGTYNALFTVTGDGQIDDSENETFVIARPVNLPPIVNAGLDKTITLPTNSVSVTGTASDSDGTVVGTNWTKVFGPADALVSFTSPNNLATTINGLTVAGTYRFWLLLIIWEQRILMKCR